VGAAKKTPVTQDPDMQGSTHDASVQEYESLREHVLTGTTAVRPCGLVVLLRHGLAAWSCRRGLYTSAPLRTPHPHTGRTPEPRICDDERHAALVPVLLDMALGRYQEVYL
jgi:hypothetical protein